MSKVVQTQCNAIKDLTRMTEGFVRNYHVKTRVIPVSIPTGWGKTRLVLSSIINTKAIKNLTIVLWPQKQDHVKEIWSDESNFPDRYETQLKWRRLKEPEKNFNKDLRKRFYYVNNNYDVDDPECTRHLLNEKGPIIFIIDEWHLRNWISDYKSEKKEIENVDLFIRSKLLPSNCNKKLLVYLISATPIATTKLMEAFNNEEVTDENACKILEESYQIFYEIISMGNRKTKYKFFSAYPSLIEKESKKLIREKDKIGKCIFIPNKNKWVEEYITISSQIRNQNRTIYLNEVLAFTNPQEPSLKMKTCLKLLKKFREERNFVIFCHHIKVAENLAKYLQDNNIPVKYLADSHLTDESTSGKRYRNIIITSNTKRKEAIKEFYDGKINLVLTDKDSQGISLQKSHAWLIHYELSWNPIRIIQRFGRVWRIYKGTNDKEAELTKPVSFYIPYTYSSEEEMINRLTRRWNILNEVDKSNQNYSVQICPVSMDIALGVRCTPEVLEE